MTNRDIADVLDEIGTYLELKGENPFKCRAFHNASRIIGALTTDVNALVTSGELQTIKGIGQGLAAEIIEMVKTGKSAYHEKLRASLPPGLTEMLRIQGLGPKRVKLLHEKLKIRSVAELKAAAERHALGKIEGFGTKTEENILRGIEHLSKHADKHLYSAAHEAATSILASLKNLKGIRRLDVAGSLRRRKEIIGDVDILASAQPGAVDAIMKAFTSHPLVDAILAKGETKSSVVLKSGINCDLRVVAEKEYPFALAYFTGSKEHNVAMRSRAKQFGWSLNEYGFSRAEERGTRARRKAPPSCESEEAIFRSLGLAYVPPELRENMGEIEAAEEGSLPRLIEDTDVRGTFHCHTTYSDGANTLPEMVEAARSLGWQYIGIADHSKVAVYARGLSAGDVKRQQKEIDTLNASFKNFRVFKGTEVDILADGSLDWSDAILASFDYVVASIHSKFKMNEVEATKRLIKALKNKHVTMLGHPTGRLLLEREGYPVNMPEVINAAADYGKAIEINAHPLRLDLDWRLCKYAKEKGVRISINPDAHNVKGLPDVAYGVGIARKGWLEGRDVINTWPLAEVQRYLNKR